MDRAKYLAARVRRLESWLDATDCDDRARWRLWGQLSEAREWLAAARRCGGVAVGRRKRGKRGPGRAEEFAWLRAHGAKYRGQWVALLGSELIATSDTLAVLQQGIPDDLPGKPLIHKVPKPLTD